MKFLDKRINTIKYAYSITPGEKWIYIKFNENGKRYSFNPDHIEIIDESADTNSSKKPHKTYTFYRQCHKCKKDTLIYTYIVYNDDTDEDVNFPWDTERLLENQDLFSHLLDSSIEYYGLKTIGSDETLDKLLAQKFPERIKTRYSKTQKRSYSMNICQHCGAKQGEYYIYRCVNERIAKMQMIDIAEEPLSLS